MRKCGKKTAILPKLKKTQNHKKNLVESPPPYSNETNQTTRGTAWTEPAAAREDAEEEEEADRLYSGTQGKPSGGNTSEG